MAGTIINVRFYSLTPLPMEIRNTFELPVWPYSRPDGEMPAELIKYFNQYGIFYYRDEIITGNSLRAGLINPEISAVPPIDCYGHSCYIDYGNRTFKVVPWWQQCSREFIKECEMQTGDKMAWTAFNEHRSLKGFNNRFIKAPLVNKIKPSKFISSKEDVR